LPIPEPAPVTSAILFEAIDLLPIFFAKNPRPENGTPQPALLHEPARVRCLKTRDFICMAEV
jgi:hypothetical protein